MKSTKSFQNNNIELLRTLAVIMVVAIHVCSFNLRESTYGSSAWWTSNIIDAFSRAAVPLFVMISGYLLLDPSKRIISVKDFFQRRVKRIGIPLAFWSMVYILIVIVFSLASDRPIRYIEIIKSIYTGAPFYHMWYLYMLVGLYLITPLFQSFIINYSFRTIFTYTIAFILLASINCIEQKDVLDSSSFFIFRALPYIGYYLLGYCISKITISKKYILPLLIASLLATILGNYFAGSAANYDTYFFRYLSVNVIVYTLCIFTLIMTFKPLPNQLFISISKYSFGIYLIHPLIIKPIEHYTLKEEIFNESGYFLIIPVEIIMVFSIAYAMSLTINKIQSLRKLV